MAAGKICKRGLFSHPTKEDTMHGTHHFSGKMLIGGKLVESIDGKWLDSINPADETKLGRVPLGSARDMDMAVEAAVQAFPAWVGLSMAKRAEYVHALADAILVKKEEFANIESLDTGNTIGPMRNDVTTAVSRMKFAAGLALEIKGETIPASPKIPRTGQDAGAQHDRTAWA
jgi:betaine-aldehyde dehydrogenase